MANTTIEADSVPTAERVQPGGASRNSGARSIPPGITEARKQLLTLFSDTTGRREASKRSTRLAIRLAAFDLFQRQGIDHVTVEQIATKAEISPRTFFNYFATKEECVLFPYQLVTPSLRLYLVAQPIDLLPMGTLEEALALFMSDMFSRVEVAQAVRTGITLHRTAPSLDKADASQKHHWEREAQAELVKRGCDHFRAEVCAVAAIGICRTAMVQWARSEPQTTIDLVVRRGFRDLQSGFVG